MCPALFLTTVLVHDLITPTFLRKYYGALILMGCIRNLRVEKYLQATQDVANEFV